MLRLLPPFLQASRCGRPEADTVKDDRRGGTPGWQSPACEVAKAHRNHFGGSGREAYAAPLPWARLECELYGPIKCGDRNWFGYLFAIICVSTGVVFVQPLRAKTEAVAALRAFARWFALRAPAMKAALGMAQRLCSLVSSGVTGVASSPAPGGATKTAFDEAARIPSSAAGWGLRTRRSRRPPTSSGFGEPWAMRLMRVSARRVRLPSSNFTP